MEFDADFKVHSHRRNGHGENQILNTSRKGSTSG